MTRFGFSVEFSEHRRYTPGDDPKDIDWLVDAKTDQHYVKKFEAETNITGYQVMDLSQSMGFTHRPELTKFESAICLAAALCYLMGHQQDPVDLVTFDERLRDVILFHILDKAEVHFPYDGTLEFADAETHERVVLDATSYRRYIQTEIAAFRGRDRQVAGVRQRSWGSRRGRSEGT